MPVGNVQRRKTGVAASQQCAAISTALKVANKAREGPPPDAAEAEEERGEKDDQSKALVDIPLCDRAITNHRRV